jgi:hypothetical protein
MAAFETDIAVDPLGKRRVPRGERSAEYNRGQSRVQYEKTDARTQIKWGQHPVAAE